MSVVAAIFPIYKLTERSPRATIAAALCLSLFPFFIVELFRPQLFRIMNVPSYLVFHNIAENFSIIVSFSIFGVGWFTYSQTRDRHALFLSAAFFAIGLMDFMHVLSYSGMPAFISPNSANKSTQFWITVRFLGALSFLISAYIHPDSRSRWLSKANLTTAALGVSAAALVGIVFFPSYVPATFIEGVGLTPFKLVSEYVIICLLLFSTAAYWRRARQTGNGSLNFYMAAFVVCIFSELSFAVYRSVFDTFNVLGHLYKAAGFLLIYMGIFITSIQLPYAGLADAGTKLRRASAYNRSLIEAAPDPLVTIGPGGKITDVNTATEKVTGCTREALVGTDFSDYFTEPDKAREGYRHAFREGSVRDFELEIRHTSGKVTPVLYNASVYRDEKGEILGVFAAARDITERKQAEEELRLGRERLALALRAGKSGTFDWDIRNNVNTWSPEIEELYGVPPGAFGGTLQAWESLVHPEDLQGAKTAVEESLKTGELAGEWRIRRKDGSVRWLTARGKVYYDEANRPVRMYGINVDNTEGKQAEESLREAGAYTRNLIEASLDPLVTIGHDGKITDVNAATEAVTGCTRGALMGTDFSDYFTDPGKARAGYQKVFREGSVRDYPLEIRREDGGATPVLYNASVYRGEDGSVAGVFAAARDVTERVKAEKALSAKVEELGRSNAELEKFAYVASHDLQEPLRIISSFTQLLSRRYRGNLDAEADEFIAYVVDGTGRMQRLINDLLAYSRVGTRGGKFEPTVCSAALGKALENLRTAVEESGAVVLHGPLPTLVADGTQLTQLFQNLVGNAIKFRASRLPEIHISARETFGEWVFSVKDNGIGIDPKYFDRIFDIFQRLHGKAEYPGSGIGLAICRKIVERHGGRLWVESAPGEGATFFFSIPGNGGTAE